MPKSALRQLSRAAFRGGLSCPPGTRLQSRSHGSALIGAPQSTLRPGCAVHRRTVNDGHCSDATMIAVPDFAAAVPLLGFLVCGYLA